MSVERSLVVVGWLARVPLVLALLVMVTGGAVVMSAGPAQAAGVLPREYVAALDDCGDVPTNHGGAECLVLGREYEAGETDTGTGDALDLGAMASVPTAGWIRCMSASCAIGKGMRFNFFKRSEPVGKSNTTKQQSAWRSSTGAPRTFGGLAGDAALMVGAVVLADKFASDVLGGLDWWDNLLNDGTCFITEGAGCSEEPEWPGEDEGFMPGQALRYTKMTKLEMNAEHTEITAMGGRCEDGPHTISNACDSFNAGRLSDYGPNITYCRVGRNYGSYVVGEIIANASWLSQTHASPGTYACSSGGAPHRADMSLVAVLTGAPSASRESCTGVTCYSPTLFNFTGEMWTAETLSEIARLDVEQACRDIATGSLDISVAIGVHGTGTAPFSTCPEGSFAESVKVWLALGDGPRIAPVHHIGIDPELDTPDIRDAIEAGAAPRVVIDGANCYYGRGVCTNWFELGQPRAQCYVGNVNVTLDMCAHLRHAYVTPYGVIQDPRQPYYPVPIISPPPGNPKPWPPTEPLPTPVQPEVPGYPRPGDPPPGAPAECPPTGHPIEAGLQPGAATVWRCMIVEYPGFSLTSGLRPGAAEWSDHKHGNAIDVGPWPAWNTNSGNAAGWDAAHWLEANAGSFGIRYVIFDNWRWPGYDGRDAWVPYSHPSGVSTPDTRHETHIHVSVSEGGQPDPRDDWGDNPAPAPEPGPGEPGPGEPGPGPGPTEPLFPIVGDNPDPGDGTDCLDGAWNWNPVSWVYTPIKCGMLWAFVPPEGSSPFDSASEALDGTTVGGWVQAPGDVFRAVAGIGGVQGAAGFDQVILGGGSSSSVQSAMITSGTMATDCKGPDVTMGLPAQLGGASVTINPFNACSMPVQFLAALLHSSLELAVWLGTFVACLNTVSAAMGLNSQLGTYHDSKMKGA